MMNGLERPLGATVKATARDSCSAAFSVAVVVVVATLTAADARAVAAEPATKKEARRHFEIGVKAARAGSYRAALEAFLRAYEISPHHAVLYNIGAAEAALGDAASAMAHFERYLADGGTSISPDRRTKVNAELRKLAAATGLVAVDVSPAGAHVTLDGVAIAAEALQAPLRANVGPRRLAATLDGHAPVERTVTIASGEIARVSLVLAPLPPAPATTPPPIARAEPAAVEPATPTPTPAAAPPPFAPPAPPPATDHGADAPAAGRTQRTIGYALGGLGLAALGTGAALYFFAYRDFKDATRLGCTQIFCPEPARAHWEDAQRGLTRSRIALAGGGALLAGGIITLLTAPSSRPATSVSVAPFMPAPAAAGLALTGRW